jgi:UDP-N-acetylglucosamine 1-carboxyvinyltransferase
MKVIGELVMYNSSIMQEVTYLNRLVVSGGHKLQGNVKISGAKNAALAVLAASLISTGESIIHNVPRILDVSYLCEIMKALGAEAEFVGANSVRVKIDSLTSSKTEYGIAKKLRASNLVLGPLLARTGEAEIPLPGGCQIGSRPMDLHVKGMKMLGADIKLEHGYIVGRAPKLVGASIYLDFPSVGATENIMMAASLAEGVTVIENCAKEPEIVDLANYLNFMGGED